VSVPAPVVAAVRTPQLAALGLTGERPLMIVDVDEVLGLFMQGFERFVVDRGYDVRIERFSLFQSVFPSGESEPITPEVGRALLNDFFRYGCGDIDPAPGAVEALRDLSTRAGVIVLSNAPDYARMARARWLGRHGLDYPLLLNTGPKGPLAAGLAAQTGRSVAFVDDLLSNLDSVEASAPRVRRFQHVADVRLQPHAPSAPERHTRLDEWPSLHAALVEALGV